MVQKRGVRQSTTVKKKSQKVEPVAEKPVQKKEETIDFSVAVGSHGGPEKVQIIDDYEIICNDIPIEVKIYNRDREYVPIYDMFIPGIGEHTRVILEKIRQQLIRTVNLGVADLTKGNKQDSEMRKIFEETIQKLVRKSFPSATEEDLKFFNSYVILRSIGLGEVELLMSDEGLEEIAINGAKQAIWVFHRKHGWLKTNIELEDNNQIRYFATTIGRKVGRQISVLEPLLDVTINVGDRVNATLMPISNEGNTITIRKFSAKPWTITDFINAGTITTEAAAILWQAIQYELSILIAGGTASGKTSMLNIIANFIPPNQRVISIEDTREVKLPSFLHWIPMLTRLANSEGKGEVTMLNLLQNSLRQRPDRIIVGEIRRPREAEVLFEAIHTGHSVYATVHANTAEETITRLTNPPINVPKVMMSALSLIVVQYRNRRNGKRRTFQVAEVTHSGDDNVLLQYEANKDKLMRKNESKVLLKSIETFTGIPVKKLKEDLKEKEKVLDWMCKAKINTVDDVGITMADYYTNRQKLFSRMK